MEPGRGDSRLVAGELAAIEHVMGERPDGCPWAAFRDPDVVAVLRAYDWHESGQCAEWWGPDPEWWLVEGVREYHRALGRARADALKVQRQRDAAKAPPLPAGATVVDTVRG